MTDLGKNEHFVIGNSIFIALLAAQWAIRETIPNRKVIAEFDLNAEPIVQHGETNTRDVHIGITFFRGDEKCRAHVTCHLYRLKKRWSPEWTRIDLDSANRYMITYSPANEDGFIAANEPVRL